MSHAPADDSRIDLVLFRAGGYLAGFEARFVRASHGANPAEQEGTRVETVLALPAPEQPAGARQRLSLKLPDGDRDILVTGPVELVSMPIADIHSLPALLAMRHSLVGLRALTLLPDRETLLLFDVAALSFPRDPENT